MNKDLSALYVLIKNNEVVAFETNLTSFVKELQKIIPDCRNYDYFYRQFRKKARLQLEGNDGEFLFAQRVL